MRFDKFDRLERINIAVRQLNEMSPQEYDAAMAAARVESPRPTRGIHAGKKLVVNPSSVNPNKRFEFVDDEEKAPVKAEPAPSTAPAPKPKPTPAPAPAPAPTPKPTPAPAPSPTPSAKKPQETIQVGSSTETGGWDIVQKVANKIYGVGDYSAGATIPRPGADKPAKPSSDAGSDGSLMGISRKTIDRWQDVADVVTAAASFVPGVGQVVGGVGQLANAAVDYAQGDKRTAVGRAGLAALNVAGPMAKAISLAKIAAPAATAARVAGRGKLASFLIKNKPVLRKTTGEAQTAKEVMKNIFPNIIGGSNRARGLAAGVPIKFGAAFADDLYNSEEQAAMEQERKKKIKKAMQEPKG